MLTACLGIATVQKIITEILPPSSGQTFAKDARDLLIECCVEFITLISSEANEISEKEAKKTIACEHVEKALMCRTCWPWRRSIRSSSRSVDISLSLLKGID
jgi:histone H3/H4